MTGDTNSIVMRKGNAKIRFDVVGKTERGQCVYPISSTGMYQRYKEAWWFKKKQVVCWEST